MRAWSNPSSPMRGTSRRTVKTRGPVAGRPERRAHRVAIGRRSEAGEVDPARDDRRPRAGPGVDRLDLAGTEAREGDDAVAPPHGRPLQGPGQPRLEGNPQPTGPALEARSTVGRRPPPRETRGATGRRTCSTAVPVGPRRPRAPKCRDGHARDPEASRARRRAWRRGPRSGSADRPGRTS